MQTDGVYYFNRCRRCNSIITKLDVLKAFRTGKDVCPCGSTMFGPTNPLWHEWFKLKMFKMIVWQLLGKLAPAPASEAVPPKPGPASFEPVAPLSSEEVPPLEEDEKQFLSLTKN